MNELEQLKKRVEILETFVNNLQSSNKIPLNVDQAFRARFIGTSSVRVDRLDAAVYPSTYQAVDEGGTDTYDVLRTPDDSLIVVDTTTGAEGIIPVYY